MSFIDIAYYICVALTGIGWAALFFAPRNRFVNWWLCGTIVPSVIAVFYTLACAIYWNDVDMSFFERFGHFTGMRAMFDGSDGLLLAGYVHYLCFDMFIGAWEARRATVQRWPYALLLVCLIVTLLFGPTGLLLFTVISVLRGQWRPGHELQS